MEVNIVVDVVLVALVVLVARVVEVVLVALVVEVPCVEAVVLVVMRTESLRVVSSLVVPVVEVVVSCDSLMGVIVFLANPSAAMEPAMQATIKNLFFIVWQIRLWGNCLNRYATP